MSSLPALIYSLPGFLLPSQPVWIVLTISDSSRLLLFHHDESMAAGTRPIKDITGPIESYSCRQLDLDDIFA